MDTSRLRNTLVSLFLLLIVMGKPASAQADGVSDERFAKLARGINLTGWFWYTPEADRALWIHDTRTAFEKYGIGWAMWEYDESFGVVSRSGGKPVVDTAVAEALGLDS